METWTDSRGFLFKLVNILATPEGWGCTVCMNEGGDADVKDNDLMFVDADEWPWVDHGQNHPSFIHHRHFELINRPEENAHASHH